MIVARYLRGLQQPEQDAGLVESAQRLVVPIKDFVGRTAEERAERLDEFCAELAACVGDLEAHLPVEDTVV